MTTRRVKGLFFVSLLLPGFIGSASAAAPDVVQTLDQVKVFGPSAVLDMTFNDPYRAVPPPQRNFSLSLETSGPLTACKLTADGAFYCLSGQTVVVWPNGPQSPVSYDLFTCGNSVQVTSCTGLTADDTGVIWLAGKNKAKTHSLVKVETCADGFLAGDGRKYCATTRYTGRPTLVDIDVVVDAAGALEGIAGLEERKTGVFFAASGTATNSPAAVTIASGRDWGLLTKEELQSLTVVAPEDLSGNRYALVATSLGRVLAKRFLTTGTSPDAVREVYPKGGTGCASPSGTPKFALRTGTDSDVVYLSDRGCLQAMALEPQVPGDAGAAFKLVRAVETFATLDQNGDPDIVGGSVVLYSRIVPILSTAPYAPEGLTPGVGLGYNLGQCTGSTPDEACQPVQGLRYWGVDGVTEAGVTIFKVEEIPDCRYIPQYCRTLLALPTPTECGGPGEPSCATYNEDLTTDNIAGLKAGKLIFDPDNVGHPAAQSLNATPLLPKQVTSLYDASGVPPNGLPPLLIGPSFKAQADSLHLFEAFFLKPEPGFSIPGTYEGEFEIALLAGRENGCEPATDALTDLLNWDSVTRSSEIHPSVLRLGAYPGDSGTAAHADMLLNVGCGSIRTKSIGVSLISYNMEPSHDTYDGSVVVVNNDAVFARMVGRLHDDIGQVLVTLACNLADGAVDTAPLKDADCLLLKPQWEDADRQLQRCLDATYQPKASSSNQNCQAFLSQFGHFKQALAPVTSNGGHDVANRRGELDLRIQVFEHVYDTRFVPSIPRGGFCVESGTCTP
jgi:hypothetical protein